MVIRSEIYLRRNEKKIVLQKTYWTKNVIYFELPSTLSSDKGI